MTGAEFVKIVDDPKNRPVLVHDSQGVIREGMIVAVWQMERMGYDQNGCMSEFNWFGHSAKPEVQKVVQKFIQNYVRQSDRERRNESSAEERETAQK